MVDVYELQDSDEARSFVIQSLWLSRSVAPSSDTVPAALEWALEIASEGAPLPPVGFVSDVGHIALEAFREAEPHLHERAAGIDPALLRKYEDYVLGKLYADMTFQRGADALLRYQGRERVRGLAFIVEQFRQRSGFGGVMLSPGLIRSLEKRPADDVLAEGWREIQQEGVLPVLVQQLEQLVQAVRDTGDILGHEDVFELEHGTALHPFGQRLALRHVLQVAAKLEQALPPHKPRAASRRRQVVTHVLDEDFYPVGGFSSISTHGSVESLLHSQLAYMERSERPDLFDMKFLRDELLYYSRDENQFLRRRQTFVFALYPGLVETRIKDSELPWQRIILVLGMLYTVTRKLIEWLSDEGLMFVFLFPHDERPNPLHQERELIATLFREQIDNGTACIADAEISDMAGLCDGWARRSKCSCLAIDTQERKVPCELTRVACLQTCASRIALRDDNDELDGPEQPDLDGECEVLNRLVALWAT